VTYFAGYRHLADRYRVEDIEAASDVVVWCCDEPPRGRLNKVITASNPRGLSVKLGDFSWRQLFVEGGQMRISSMRSRQHCGTPSALLAAQRVTI